MVDNLLQVNERIDQLSAQGIQIIQSSEVFAFSLDAVLLADFVRPNQKRKLKTVDLCAGNGAIGLFLNRKLGGQIIEVELQERLANMAKRSIQLNELSDRYQVLNVDVKQIYDYVPKDSADIVVCNPPYFKDHPQSEKNPNQYLALARHEIALNLQDVIEKMSGLLKMNGKAYLVHRPERLTEILSLMTSLRLEPKQVRLIYPKVGRDANMVLIEAIKDGKKGGLKVVPPLIVANEKGEYVPEVMAMLNGC